MPKTTKEIQNNWIKNSNKYDFEGNRLSSSEKHQRFDNIKCVRNNSKTVNTVADAKNTLEIAMRCMK